MVPLHPFEGETCVFLCQAFTFHSLNVALKGNKGYKSLWGPQVCWTEIDFACCIAARIMTICRNMTPASIYA